MRIFDPRRPGVFVRIWPPILLMLISTAVGFVLLEVGWSVWSKQRPRGQVDFSKRIMFFDSRQSVFENRAGIFFYTPNNTVRSKSIYFSENSFDVEYDYTFRTNNLGLVQEHEVLTGKPSLLILGDSFTEGQGSEPWFERLAPLVEKIGLQPINGGLLGTGFEQWWKLENDLAGRGVLVEKLAVIFISDDFSRKVWNFRPNWLNCLNRVSPCDGTEVFLALPPEADIPGWVDKIRRLRAPKALTGIPALKATLAALAPATFQVYQSLQALLFPPPPDPNALLHQKASRAVIGEMLKKYGARNIVFIHLPQKEEVGHRPSTLGLRARTSIAEAGGTLYDGFRECRLTLGDFHVHDGHPNRAGYAKIASCVTDALALIGPKLPAAQDFNSR